MDNWMEGQEEEQNDTITLYIIFIVSSRTGMHLPISNIDIRGWYS